MASAKPRRRIASRQIDRAGESRITPTAVNCWKRSCAHAETRPARSAGERAKDKAAIMFAGDQPRQVGKGARVAPVDGGIRIRAQQ